MRLAIHDPAIEPHNRANIWHGCMFDLIRQFKPVLFLRGWRRFVTQGARLRNDLRAAGLDPGEIEFAFTTSELNRKADVLLCFRQDASQPRHRPPRNFRGMKIWHTMEGNYHPTASNAALVEGGVTYLMANGRQDKYCPFYRQSYPAFVGRVIPVPFGFADRFQNTRPFAERTRKVIGFGAINLVDPSDGTDSRDPRYPLYEWVQFFRGERFTQSWRRRLVEHAAQLTDVLDCHFPVYPAQSGFNVDAVTALNGHALFANDESIAPFAPGRTFEGTACGAAMISSDHECFKDLGFVDGVNCIMHRRLDVEDFREKARHYIQRPAELQAIAAAGCAMVREKYSHATIARNLHAEIEKRWQKG
jgi:hypothetical protein